MLLRVSAPALALDQLQAVSPPPSELLVEWDNAANNNRDRLVSLLRELGASALTLHYVSHLRLYLRAPYLLTLWVPDRVRRTELAYELTMHVLAMKLFDDLLDNDTTIDRYELGTCMILWTMSTRLLCRRARDPHTVLDVLQDDFTTISVGQLRTKRRPAETFDEWRAHADTYGAAFLGCYGTLAAIAGGVPEASSAAHALGRGFGMIVTIADDLRDYDRQGERSGNLGHLLLTGCATADEVVWLVDEMRALATAELHSAEPAHDVVPVVDAYAQDVVGRLLPPFVVGAV